MQCILRAWCSAWHKVIVFSSGKCLAVVYSLGIKNACLIYLTWYHHDCVDNAHLSVQ